MSEPERTKKNPARRFAAVALAAAIVATSAPAIERYRTVPLADLGFGSTIQGLDPGSTATVGEFLGSVFDANGTELAVSWGEGDWNGDGFTQIFGGDGNDRVAVAGLKDLAGEKAVVGVKTHPYFAVTRDVAVLWRQSEVGGEYSELVLLDPSSPEFLGAASRANDVAQLADGRLMVVGTLQPAGARSRPASWQEVGPGAFEMTVLNGLNGPGGEATALIREVVPDGVVVFGHSTDRWGRRRATAWRQDPSGQWQAIDLGALGNAGSAVFGAASIRGGEGNDTFVLVGDSFARNGRRLGTMWIGPDPGPGVLLPAPPPAGFANSSARAIQPEVQPLKGPDLVNFRAAGAAWNRLNAGDVGLGDLTAAVYPARPRGLETECPAAYGGIRLAAIQESGDWHPLVVTAVGSNGELAGVGYATADPTLRAFVALPTEVLLPDCVTAPIGRIVASQTSAVHPGEELYRADGVPLRVLSRRAGGQRQVVVDTLVGSFQTNASGNDEFQATVVINGLCNNEVCEGGFTVQALAILEPDDQWVLIDERSIGTSTEVWALPPIGAEGVDSDSGAIQLRLRVTNDQTRGAWGVEIDQILIDLTTAGVAAGS